MTLTKAQFRKDCLTKLQSLPSHNKYYRDLLVCKNLLSELGKIKNKSILFYYPINFEVDIKKVMHNMRRKNSICLPFMQGQSFKMVAYRLPLSKKKFGIFEAGNSLKSIKKIDIAIVPILGVDGNLKRIGFGKGMYDRFFSKVKKKPYTIFIQATTCYTREKICNNYDISCDILLTPRARKLAKKYI